MTWYPKRGFVHEVCLGPDDKPLYLTPKKPPTNVTGMLKDMLYTSKTGRTYYIDEKGNASRVFEFDGVTPYLEKDGEMHKTTWEELRKLLK